MKLKNIKRQSRIDFFKISYSAVELGSFLCSCYLSLISVENLALVI